MRNIELSEIKVMEKQAREQEGVISLAQGYPDFPTPWTIIEFVKAHLNEPQWQHYTLSSGSMKLREMISMSLAKDNTYYDPHSEIIVTAGANAGLMATLLACFQPGESIATFTPTYASYFKQFQLAGVNPIYIPLKEKGWSIDLDLFSDRIRSHKPKAILLCNPNNPTGTLLSKEELIEIGHIAMKNGLFIICDEVYSFLLYDNKEYFSLSQIPMFKDIFVKIQSFSKKYAMTGWRVGYICGPEKIISQILSVHDLMVNCAPSFSQLAAIAALQLGEKFVPQFVSEFAERREYVHEWLHTMDKYLIAEKPKGTYFYLIKLLHPEMRFAYELLEKAKVSVVPGSAFGPFYNDYFRISFAKDIDILHEALLRITNYLIPHYTNQIMPSTSMSMVSNA